MWPASCIGPDVLKISIFRIKNFHHQPIKIMCWMHYGICKVSAKTGYKGDIKHQTVWMKVKHDTSAASDDRPPWER